MVVLSDNAVKDGYVFWLIICPHIYEDIYIYVLHVWDLGLVNQL